MKILFILDPLPSLKTYKDTSFAMMVEAAKRGHEIHYAPQEGLMWKGGRVVGEHCRLHLVSAEKYLGNPALHDEDWYRLELPPHETPLTAFDAVLMRKDPPFDLEYVTSTWLLEMAAREGARVFNAPDAVRDHNEKLAIAEFPQFAVPTLVSRLEGQVQAFIDEQADVVLKRLDGMGGASVFRVTDRDPNRNVIVETITALGTRSVMAQRYIPEIRDGDKRVLLIDGPAGAALPRAHPEAGRVARQPRRRAARRGAAGHRAPPRDRGAARPDASERGLLLVGLDVIGDWLTEVNVTSPTCFREIQTRPASTSPGCSSMRSRPPFAAGPGTRGRTGA